MSRRYLFVALACALGAAGLAQTQSQAQNAGGFGPNEVVRARQAAFSLSAGDFMALRAAAGMSIEPGKVAGQAGALRRWAHTLPIMFPAGTAMGQTSAPTQARPLIWSDSAGFSARASAFALATDHLADASKANDPAAFKAAVGEVGKACGACHDVYRAEERHG